MINVHHCKTTSHKETILKDASILQQRQALQELLHKHQAVKAYETLLRTASSVEVIQERAECIIPMRRSIVGLYLIPVIIDGVTYRFVLDTGAQISSISQRLIQTHRLKQLPGAISIGSIGGKQSELHGYLMPELRLGSVTVRRLPMVGLAAQELQLQVGAFDFSLFDGIIGWDLLSRFDFELDDVAKQCKLLNNRFSFPYPNMVKALFPIFLVKDAHGNTLTMGFDSGARASWMSEKAMKKYGYEVSDEIRAVGLGVHGVEEMNIRLIHEINLYLYKAQITLKRLHTGRTNIFPEVEFDGILGNEIFRNRRIRLINSKEMVLLR